MDMRLSWTPVAEEQAADATFEYWLTPAATERWWVHSIRFGTNDRGVGDDRISAFIDNERRLVVATYQRYMTLRAALDERVARPRDQVGTATYPLWRQVTYTQAPDIAGFVVTQGFYTQQAGGALWYPEARTVTAVGTQTPAQHLREFDRRTSEIVSMYLRGRQIEGGLSFPVGVRFTIP